MEKAKLAVIRFTSEDILTTSGGLKCSSNPPEGNWSLSSYNSSTGYGVDIAPGVMIYTASSNTVIEKNGTIKTGLGDLCLKKDNYYHYDESTKKQNEYTNNYYATRWYECDNGACQ